MGVKLTDPRNDVFNNFTVKASTEVTKNLLCKAKFFTRVMRELNHSIYFTSSLHAGVIINNANRLRVNDSFYLHNFKGIRNLGYHYDAQDKIGGDILGFDKYALLQLKLSQ